MVDVDAQVAAVTRGVRTDTVDGHEARIQTLSQEYASDLDDVWDALTSAERIPRWFLPVSGDLRLGGRYQLEGNAGGEILECDAPENGRARYYATWEFGGGVSWIEVEATAVTDETTRVQLTHIARVADVPAEFWDQFGPGATGVGWDGGFLGLSMHLTHQSGVTPETAEAWAVSDEGKRFYRGAAEKWAAAHVASGAVEETARRMADNTAAFYTGEGA